MTDARELVEQVARAWASMDGNADRFDACKADPSLDETEGRYIGYMADAEALMERSGITAQAEENRRLREALYDVVFEYDPSDTCQNAMSMRDIARAALSSGEGA